MAEAFKNVFNARFVDELGRGIQTVLADFDTASFAAAVLDSQWEQREFKDRMRHITICLREFLPHDFPEAVNILMSASSDFSGLPHFIFADYVEQYGLDHFETSMAALELFTVNSTAEFAVRPFIIRETDKTMKQMKAWADHENEHFRRLASEGCRPRLPWAQALPGFKKDPSPVLEILEKLKDDDSEYVRKSVANNLNDISKDHPELVLDVVRRWLGTSSRTDWIVKHACRTLLKAGDERALLLFGYESPDHIEIRGWTCQSEVRVGDYLNFSFDIATGQEQFGLLRIEYAIHFRLANGTLSPKVFKISEGRFPGTLRHVDRRHSFKPITTRRYYAGGHEVSIIINGREMARAGFILQSDP